MATPVGLATTADDGEIDSAAGQRRKRFFKHVYRAKTAAIQPRFCSKRKFLHVVTVFDGYDKNPCARPKQWRRMTQALKRRWRSAPVQATRQGSDP